MSLTYEDKYDLDELEEGDRVTMHIKPHNFSKTGHVLTGTITDFLRESQIEYLNDPDTRGRPMADVAVKGEDTGEVWRWNVDNGYVIGPVDHPDRPDRSDIGKIQGLYPPSARDEFDKKHDAGTD